MIALPAVARAGGLTLDTIHHCSAETLLAALPDNSIDLVVTSPPYNLRNSTGNGLKGDNTKSLWTNRAFQHGYANHSDDMPHDVYIDWQRNTLVECMRVLKPSGAIFYNHKWRVQDGVLQRLVDEITHNLPVRQIIIWSRGNGVNFNAGYFLPTFEVIYLIAKPDFVLQPNTNTLKDVWQFPPEEIKKHPNAFPVELPERCIEAGSTSGGIILDPFMGSGTTALAATKLQRHYIGCDISPAYVSMARERVSHGVTLPLFAEAAGE